MGVGVLLGEAMDQKGNDMHHWLETYLPPGDSGRKPYKGDEEVYPHWQRNYITSIVPEKVKKKVRRARK